jgi:hypothetical protein
VKGDYAITTFNLTYDNKKILFEIKPVEGESGLLPETRQYNLIFHAFHEPTKITVMINGEQKQLEWIFDQNQQNFTLANIELSPESELQVHLECNDVFLDDNDQKKTIIKNMLKSFKMESYVKQAIDLHLDEFLDDPRWITRYADRMTASHLLALVEIWQGKHEQRLLEDPKIAYQSLISRVYHG